ncbi:tetracycline resistance protein from transposon [Colletotrichum tabaci]|uniref:Tetracycline resistance protein from transposon n=1 Tax=Colletotrichum tabaci TaxID=1209068 RepID=A0AAV9TRI2_9PEZI
MPARPPYLAIVEAAVFEGEASPDFRSQSGSLDLHTENGLAALKQAGLFDEFLNSIQERPEIDRPKLRELLAESLPVAVIKWGHHLKEVTHKQSHL